MKKSKFSIVFIVAVILGFAGIVYACAPVFLDACFFCVEDWQDHLQFKRIGVIQPGQSTRSMILSYRRLKGHDIKIVRQERSEWEYASAGVYAGQVSVEEWEKESMMFAEKFNIKSKLRNSGYNLSRTTSNDYYYNNCGYDAFRNALETYRNRVNSFGGKSLEVKEWFIAQDMVFSNCSGSGREIPPDAPEGVNEIIKKDRIYQQAAAYFYSEGFDEAEKLFRSIANDKSSPWHKIAPLLVVRTIVRRASLLEPYKSEKYEERYLTQAEKEVKAILDNQYLSDYHAAASDLSNLIRVRLHTDEVIREITKKFLAKKIGVTFDDLVHEYTYIIKMSSKRSATLVQRKDELSDWITNFNVTQNSKYAINKWKKKKTALWLLSAMTHIKGNDPASDEIISAIDTIQPESPVYMSARYHKLRLMVEKGNKKEAYAILDWAAASKNEMSAVDWNLFAAQGLVVSRTLDEFLEYAKRIPVRFTYNIRDEVLEDVKMSEKDKKEIFFNEDSTTILNKRMPIKLLITAAKSGKLPYNLSRSVGISAWIRAVILGDEMSAFEAADIVVAHVPEAGALMKEYKGASTREERGFIAALIILKFPGMRPFVEKGLGKTGKFKKPLTVFDMYSRFNWWCDYQGDYNYSNDYQDDENNNIYYDRDNLIGWQFPQVLKSGSKNVFYPEFMTSDEIEVVKAERKVFASIEQVAPNYLASKVVAYVKSFPGNVHAPEALHYAVRASRYGCKDDNTAGFSYDAFKLLHKKYAKSEWARKTKYY